MTENVTYIATFQKHYRSDPGTCLVTLPSEGLTPEEFLESVQTQCKDYSFNKDRKIFHQISEKDYLNPAILALIKIPT